MVKMSPFAVSVTILVLLSAINADVSHLNGQNGYRYSNVGLTSGLKLHSPESDPAPTQYHATYGNGASSYEPPASGSPFSSAAPLPQVPIPSPRLSVPLQSPLLTAQKFGQTQFKSQASLQRFQQPRTYQTPTYQAPPYIAPAYQPQTYQAQTYQAPTLQSTFQTQGFATNTFNNGHATQRQITQTQTQPQYQNNQEPIITKHFFVHAAPEDPEEDAGPRLVQIGRPRKNYKIIFIKTPSYSQKQQIIPVLPQTEEKTIVYVLSKKPTFNQNIEIPEPPPTQPSKPDVFFIKYKTKEEAEQAQQQIQAAYDSANLSGSNESIGQIAARFASGSDLSSTAFGGQATQQSNYQQQAGQHTSTKRNVA
ncbi:uncharacterized protein LOC129566167 [Sitodiplosis mosellana]|uniref:uncharacterized protein LOC129566167 n=1 Tax=Sitodiplosis mosellana TaxID=263140 RepID=UPI0024450E48|nr:uncharacterized protein LOC129566167 [Sitodiplosis mosellana]